MAVIVPPGKKAGDKMVVAAEDSPQWKAGHDRRADIKLLESLVSAISELSTSIGS